VNLDGLRGLKQADQRSCGPSSLVVAHMLLDQAYAATQNPHAFAGSVLALHRELTSPSFGGRAQLPWPRALGTPPWAVAHAMTAYAGIPYRSRVVRWGGRADDLDALRAAVDAGRPCPMYVGSRWLPRHVVLAVAPGADAGSVQVYNPARGTVAELTREAFESGTLTTFGSWTYPWFVVLPKA
jgi:hypothetical protein